MSSETEVRLRERAAREGQDVDTLADVLLLDALADDPDDLTEEETAQVRAGIRRGIIACEEGRAKPVSEWAARLREDCDLPTHRNDEALARES